MLGGEAGERRVEGQLDRAVEPGCGKEPQLGSIRTQTERRRVGLKEAARVRFEGQRRRRPPGGPRPGDRGVDHGAMAAMHPVEIADGDHGAAQPVESRSGVPHDDKGLHRRVLGHGAAVWGRNSPVKVD